MCSSLSEPDQVEYQLGLSSRKTSLLASNMSVTSLLQGDQVECAYCKDTKPASDTTWFMAEPGEKSVRLCDFCYEEARKQLRLLRIVRSRGDYPLEAAS